jgi:hypothetical protein
LAAHSRHRASSPAPCLRTDACSPHSPPERLAGYGCAPAARRRSELAIPASDSEAPTGQTRAITTRSALKPRSTVRSAENVRT